jgi:hypothetical protein
MFLRNIIDKYIEFNKYLNEINIEDFKQFSREELTEFNSTLRKSDDFRFLCLEIDEIVKEKKLQEYPELLGVHHYPEIKKLDCISDEDKIKLDNYLADMRFNSYIYKHSDKWDRLSKKWDKDVSDKVFEFLISNNIIKRFYKLKVCHDTMIFDDEKINKYFKLFSLKKRTDKLSDKEWEEYNELEQELDYLEYCCIDCDREICITKEMITSLINNSNAYMYKVIKERDKTFDNK